MKDNMEDLLKQVYAQKEEPSREFCQSVIQKMKGENQKGFLGTGEKVYYRGILIAAICAGVIILAGVGMHFCLKGGLQDREAFQKQRIAEHGDPVSDTTEEASGAKNKVETANTPDGENPSETKNGSDARKRVETSSMPDNMQEHQKENSGADDGYPPKADANSGTVSGSNHNPSTKPGGTRAEGSDAESNSDTGSENRKPQITETAEPKGTSKPTGDSALIEALKPPRTSEPEGTSRPLLPAKTMPPQRTPNPQKTPKPWENYIAVCSVETYAFSLSPQASTGGEICFPDSLFDSQLILSYEQLQTLIREIEREWAYIPDDGLQNILLRLREYDPSYFVSNALCLDLSRMDAGVDLKLQVVWIQNMEQGNYCLDICLDKVYDETEQTSGMQYYSNFVSVPQTIARQCSTVQFHFSG